MVLSRLGIFYIRTNGALIARGSVIARALQRLPLWFPIRLLDARVGNDYESCIEVRWSFRATR